MPRACVGPFVLAIAAAAAVLPAQEEPAPRDLLRSAQLHYEEERFAEALALVERALAAAPGDEKVLMVGAWCQLRLAGPEPERLRQAQAWFDQIAQGRSRSELSSQMLLGSGLCRQQLAAAAATEAERRRHLRSAESAFTDLVERQEQLPDALRWRTEVRLALGATDAALADARAFEDRVAELCEQMEGRAIATRQAEYRRELDRHIARRRGEVASLQARVALHQWSAGDHAAAEQRVLAWLSAAEPPFEVPAVAEAVARLAPDDPRAAPAHVFRMQHATRESERCEAAIALGRLGASASAALPALSRAASGADVAVARAAVTALGMIGPAAADALPVIEGLLGHADAELAACARAALRSIAGQDPERRRTAGEGVIVRGVTESSLYAGEGRDGAGGKFGGRQRGRAKMMAKPARPTAQAISAALDWLAAHQDPDGKWDADGFPQHDQGIPSDGAGSPVVDVAVTAYALLAFLNDGTHPAGGPHREVVRRGVVWLVRQQDPETGRIGLPAHPRALLHHTVATLVVLEAYVQSGYEGLRPRGQRAVSFLEGERAPGGGWSLHTGLDGDDAVATAWALLVHEVAGDAGLDADQAARVEAVAALVAAAGAEAATPRKSAACLLGFFFGGMARDTLFDRLADRCVAQAPGEWVGAEAMTWLLASRGLFQMGGRHWTEWSRRLSIAVVAGQRRDGSFAGSWDPDAAWGKDGGRVYATALGALSLESYYGYSRLFVR